MKKLKVIQIGGEHDHAAPVFSSLRRQSDLFDVLGYVIPEDDLNYQFDGAKQYFAGSKPSEGAKKHFQDMPRYTLEEALKLPGLEGAVIETSEKKLTKYARIAAEHGLHVHMDKPGSEDGEEYQDLIRYMKEHGTVFSTGYMYRYNPAVKELLEMKKRGDLGEIVYVQAQMNCLHRPEKRDWLHLYKGGMMFFLGCHLIDLILQLQGEPEEVIPCNMCTGLDGVRGEDFGMALLRYPRGISFAKTTAVELGGFMRRQLVVAGTKATVEINPLEYSISGEVKNQCTDMFVTTTEDCARHGWGARGEKQTRGPVNRYDDMMRAWGEAALGLAPMPVDLDYEAKLHRYVLKASGIIK